MNGVGSTMRQTLRGGLRLSGGASLDSEVDVVDEEDGVLSDSREEDGLKRGDVEDGEKAHAMPTMDRIRDVVNFMIASSFLCLNGVIDRLIR